MQQFIKSLTFWISSVWKFLKFLVIHKNIELEVEVVVVWFFLIDFSSFGLFW